METQRDKGRQPPRCREPETEWNHKYYHHHNGAEREIERGRDIGRGRSIPEGEKVI